MITVKSNFFRLLFMLAIVLFTTGCSDDDEVKQKKEEEGKEAKYPRYYISVTAATDPVVEVLLDSEDVTKGVISPVNNGIQFQQNTTFFGEKNTIFTSSGYPQTKFQKYEVIKGKLTKNKNTFTIEPIYAKVKVDDNTLLLMASPREGVGAKTLYVVNSKTMSVINEKKLDFGTLDYEVDYPGVGKVKLTSFPTDLLVKNGKLYVSYFTKDETKNFTTPVANEAQIAIFSYPSLKFEKIITDKRVPNIGRYNSVNVLEEDEKGNVYTFASSSYLSGFYPLPATNSGILRVKKNEDKFDADFHIDFEKISNGYKIYDMFYVANDKAVVRVVKEDESLASPKTFYGAYQKPVVEMGIVNLNKKTFTKLNVPKALGGFSSATFKEGSKLYIGLSTGKTSNVYIIDVDTETVTKGLEVKGKLISSLMKITK